jgi:hypothetical protein
LGKELERLSMKGSSDNSSEGKAGPDRILSQARGIFVSFQKTLSVADLLFGSFRA